MATRSARPPWAAMLGLTSVEDRDDPAGPAGRTGQPAPPACGGRSARDRRRVRIDDDQPALPVGIGDEVEGRTLEPVDARLGMTTGRSSSCWTTSPPLASSRRRKYMS